MSGRLLERLGRGLGHWYRDEDLMAAGRVGNSGYGSGKDGACIRIDTPDHYPVLFYWCFGDCGQLSCHPLNMKEADTYIVALRSR
jgi:hypothetical protein